MKKLALICAVGSFVCAALSLSIAHIALGVVCLTVGCIYSAYLVTAK
jgi:hypothetical protein